MDASDAVVDVIDLDEEESSEDLIYDWDTSCGRQLAKFAAADSENILGSLMKEYLESLQDMTRKLDGNEFLNKRVFCHINFLHSYFVELRSYNPDTYLNYMEDILTIYCNLKLEEIRHLKKNKGHKKKMSTCQHLSRVLTIYLLERNDHILHVLIKMKSYTGSDSCSEVLNIIYKHFLVNVPASNLCDESFCRSFIVLQKWKSIRNPDEWEQMDKIVYRMFRRTPESITENEVLKRILMPDIESVVDLALNFFRPSVTMTAYFKHIESEKDAAFKNFDFSEDLNESQTAEIIKIEDEDDVLLREAFDSLEIEMAKIPRSNSPVVTCKIETFEEPAEDLDVVEDTLENLFAVEPSVLENGIEPATTEELPPVTNAIEVESSPDPIVPAPVIIPAEEPITVELPAQPDIEEKPLGLPDVVHSETTNSDLEFAESDRNNSFEMNTPPSETQLEEQNYKQDKMLYCPNISESSVVHEVVPVQPTAFYNQLTPPHDTNDSNFSIKSPKSGKDCSRPESIFDEFNNGAFEERKNGKFVEAPPHPTHRPNGEPVKTGKKRKSKTPLVAEKKKKVAGIKVASFQTLSNNANPAQHNDDFSDIFSGSVSSFLSTSNNGGYVPSPLEKLDIFRTEPVKDLGSRSGSPEMASPHFERFEQSPGDFKTHYDGLSTSTSRALCRFSDNCGYLANLEVPASCSKDLYLTARVPRVKIARVAFLEKHLEKRLTKPSRLLYQVEYDKQSKSKGITDRDVIRSLVPQKTWTISSNVKGPPQSPNASNGEPDFAKFDSPTRATTRRIREKNDADVPNCRSVTMSPTLKKDDFDRKHSIALFSSAYAIRGNRNTMEDRFLIDEGPLDSGRGVGLFAVFDGHGGAGAVDYTFKALKRKIGARISALGGGGAVSEYEHVLREEILATDRELFASKEPSGTTAIVAVLVRSELVVANVGDSRAILCNKRGPAVELSTDHKPEDIVERLRIEAAGGFVEEYANAYRVNKQLAMSRSLGDYSLKTVITAEPEVRTCHVHRQKAAFVVMATDGLWDVMSNEAVRDFVRQEFHQEDYGARSLVQHAYKLGSMDNITAVIINLNKYNTNYYR